MPWGLKDRIALLFTIVHDKVAVNEYVRFLQKNSVSLTTYALQQPMLPTESLTIPQQPPWTGSYQMNYTRIFPNLNGS